MPFAYPSLRDKMREAARRTVAAYIDARQDEFPQLEFSEKAIELNLGNGVSVAAGSTSCGAGTAATLRLST